MSGGAWWAAVHGAAQSQTRPKRLGSSVYMSILISEFIHCSTIYNSQDTETTLMFNDRFMGKEDVVHIYNGIRLSHKMEQNWFICRDADGHSLSCHME